jgi:hypothetical protein
MAAVHLKERAARHHTPATMPPAITPRHRSADAKMQQRHGLAVFRWHGYCLQSTARAAIGSSNLVHNGVNLPISPVS